MAALLIHLHCEVLHLGRQMRRRFANGFQPCLGRQDGIELVCDRLTHWRRQVAVQGIAIPRHGDFFLPFTFDQDREFISFRQGGLEFQPTARFMNVPLDNLLAGFAKFLTQPLQFSAEGSPLQGVLVQERFQSQIFYLARRQLETFTAISARVDQRVEHRGKRN